MELKKIPLTSGKVCCNHCRHRFAISIAENVNCRVGVFEHAVTDFDLSGRPVGNDGPYLVMKPFCEGFSYDLKALSRLIRTGLVDHFTQVLPPHGDEYLPAGELLELRCYFEEVERIPPVRRVAIA